MNIAIVAPFNPSSVVELLSENDVVSINQSASSVNNLVRGLVLSGIDVTVFTLNYFDNNNSIYNGPHLAVNVIGARSRFKLFRIFPNLAESSRRLKRSIYKSIDNLDAIHCHWCYEYALASSSFQNFRPVFCTVRDWAPVIYHNIKVQGSLFRLLTKFYWAYKRVVFDKVMSQRHIHFIANSEYTKNLINSKTGCTTIPILYNSIEDDKIVNVLPHFNKNNINITTISADVDDYRKNIRTLIDAFSVLLKTFPNATLTVVGHYRANEGINKYVHEHNLESNVIFTGLMKRDELIKLIDGSTCIAHPAIEETFGNTLLEGMARGIPVFGGETSGAVPYVLNNGEFGLLCDVTSSSDMVEVLSKYCSDEDIWNHYSTKGHTHVISTFSNSVISKKHIELYTSFIG